MWNKYPSSSTAWSVAVSVLFSCLLALNAMSCASNPTPHPVADAGVSYEDPNRNGGVETGAAPSALDAHDIDGGHADAGEDAGDSLSDPGDDVGPDDVGGSTEPLG